MTENLAILELHDLHLLESELRDPIAQARLRKVGLGMEPGPALERARQRISDIIDRRWMYLYERAYHRYGRGVAAVRERVCQGCHITLPTSKTPSAAGTLTLCESCGRILYWG